MRSRILKITAVLAITLLGLGLRYYAASTLRVDVDEPTYLRAAVNYAAYLRQGTWKWLIYYNYNSEHPAFYKIVYGAAELVQPPIPSPEKPRIRPTEPIQSAPSRLWILTGRYTSAAFSTLAVLALAAANPLAGLFLAVQTLGIKYTSSFYLEGLPFLTSLLAALAYQAWFRRINRPGPVPRQTHIWLLLSAGFVGMTAASKYVYLVVGLAIAVHYAIHAVKNRFPRQYTGLVAVWLLAALLSFYVFDPYLWKHPIENLLHSLTYFVNYTGSRYVVKASYPVYQPLLWLFKSYPDHFPYDRGSFVVNLDVPISVLAALGAFWLFKKNSFFFTWLVVALAVLLAWPTKWPQYTVMILPPLCWSASEGAAWLLSYPRRWLERGPLRQPEGPTE